MFKHDNSGYAPILEWVAAFAGVEGGNPDLLTIEQISAALDVLKGYLGQENCPDDDAALCGIHIIPPRVWQQKTRDLLKSGLRHGSIRYAHAWGDGVQGDVMVRRDLKIPQSRPLPAKAGRKAIYNWEVGVSRVWARIYQEGGESRLSVAAVVNLLKDEMQDQDGGHPGDTECKKRARMILEHLEQLQSRD